MEGTGVLRLLKQWYGTVTASPLFEQITTLNQCGANTVTGRSPFVTFFPPLRLNIELQSLVLPAELLLFDHD